MKGSNPGDALIVDGGSALFKLPVTSPDSSERPKLREQASLVASSLARMGVSAANVGRYDLAEGPKFLTDLQAATGIPYVSSNLRAKDGALLFPPSRTLPWGSRKAFIFGLTRPEPNIDPTLGFSVDDPISAAKALLSSVDPDDLVICLTDIGYSGEHELARQLPRINLIVGGGEGTKILQAPIPIGNSLLLRAADRGRELGALTLTLGSKGWTRPVNAKSLRSTATGLEALGQDALSRGSTNIDTRLIAELSEGANKIEGPPGASFANSIILLDSSVGDDPSTLKAVNAFTARWASQPKSKTRPPSPPRPAATPPKSAPAPVKVAPSTPTPGGPDTAGDTASCRRCHGEAYEKWLKTAHSSSLARLPKEGRSNPACGNCHSGIAIVGGREVREPVVGCHACHGAAAGHPGKAKVKRSVGEKVCSACHRNEHGNAVFDFRRGFEAVRCDRL